MRLSDFIPVARMEIDDRATLAAQQAVAAYLQTELAPYLDQLDHYLVALETRVAACEQRADDIDRHVTAIEQLIDVLGGRVNILEAAFAEESGEQPPA